jgi:hypothetical protein
MVSAQEITGSLAKAYGEIHLDFRGVLIKQRKKNYVVNTGLGDLIHFVL